MIEKHLLTLLSFLFLSCQASGVYDEEFTIRGRIYDENHSPMAGAAISIVNTTQGTYSDDNGYFNLTFNKTGEYQIRISYTGYETLIKKIIVPDTFIFEIFLYPLITRTEEVIVSATRAGARAPFTYSGISGEILKKNNLSQDLPYIIGLTPSLVETSESGTGVGYTGFRIRGTDASRINITIDGIPLNDAESQQVFWVDLPDLASSVDNIQVQRGVGTSSNGAGAFGATVNLQSRNPESEPFTEIITSAGSFNTFKSTVMAGTGLIRDNFAFQFRYSVLGSSGYVKRTGADNNALAITGMYKTGKSLVKVNFLTGEEHTGISWWGVPSEKLSSDRRYNPAGEYTTENGEIKYYENESDNYRQNHFQLIYSNVLNRSLSFHTALHYTHGKGYYEEYREDQIFADYGIPPFTIDTIRVSSTDLVRRKWMGNDFYGLVYSINYRKDKAEAVLGGGLNYYLGDHFGKIIWMKYSGNVEKDHQWYFNDAGKGEYSFYGKLSYRLNDKLTGFGDLQFRHISYKMKGNDDDLRDISQSHFYDFFNPKAGLHLSISPRQEAYLSFSVAHKEPTRANFKDAAGDAGATPLAETLYDTEAGYLYKSEKLNLGINLFYMFYKDQLVPTGELSNVGYPIMTNVKNSYRKGIEITFSLKPGQWIDWNLSTTLSRNKIKGFTEYYTDYNTSDWSSEYKSKYLGTVDIAYSPGITGVSDITFTLSDKIKTHLISKYVGKQYFDNTMNCQRMIDPYFVNNLRLDIEPDIKKIKMMELQFLVNNIFNSMYESNAYGGNWYENGNENTWAYYFPQAGINFMVKLGLRF